MDKRIITVINKETREVIACVGPVDIVCKNGYDVIISNENDKIYAETETRSKG